MARKLKTRKEMITYCVDDQIKRGVIKPENRTFQIKWRLFGANGVPAMSWYQCDRWYNEVLEKNMKGE